MSAVPGLESGVSTDESGHRVSAVPGFGSGFSPDET